MKICYQGQAGTGFGWGVCNGYLLRELPQFCTLLTTPQDADVCVQPVADHDLNPALTMLPINGVPTVGYAFAEYPLGPKAAENASQYRAILGGSEWCSAKLRAVGVRSEPLVQGVDHSIFHPDSAKRLPGKYTFFSGGKLEIRKGQDIVIRAFADVLERGCDAMLAVSWTNPWPRLIYTMLESGLQWEWGADIFSRSVTALCAANGIPRERLIVLPPFAHPDLARLYCSITDCGVFPNRAEGGTNLVMMEYAACGKPVLASGSTGHADVRSLITREIKTLPARFHDWPEPSPESLADAMADAYHLRLSRAERMPQYSWKDTARRLVDVLNVIL